MDRIHTVVVVGSVMSMVVEVVALLVSYLPACGCVIVQIMFLSDVIMAVAPAAAWYFMRPSSVGFNRPQQQLFSMRMDEGHVPAACVFRLL